MSDLASIVGNAASDFGALFFGIIIIGFLIVMLLGVLQNYISSKTEIKNKEKQRALKKHNSRLRLNEMKIATIEKRLSLLATTDSAKILRNSRSIIESALADIRANGLFSEDEMNSFSEGIQIRLSEKINDEARRIGKYYLDCYQSGTKSKNEVIGNLIILIGTISVTMLNSEIALLELDGIRQIIETESRNKSKLTAGST